MLRKLSMATALLAVASLVLVAGCKGKESANQEETGGGTTGYQGRTQDNAPNLINQLRSGSEDARAKAAEKLGDMGGNPAAVRALSTALNDPSEKVRENAGKSLAKINTAESLMALRQGAQNMKNRNQSDWEKVQKDYNKAIDNLRDKANGGDQNAKTILSQLGESQAAGGGATGQRDTGGGTIEHPANRTNQPTTAPGGLGGATGNEPAATPGATERNPTTPPGSR